MKTFYDIGSFKKYLKSQRSVSKNIGFVPTMGALHQGHLALVEQSVRENNLTICSIFVNPAQFNNAEDLEKYPRPIESDIQILENIGCDIALIPDSSEMYPKENPLSFNLGYLDEIMEGKFRPGHFNGVCLIIAKFFNIIHPNVAYFGRKDLQQFVVINKLKEALMFDLDLKCINTIREKDGLALSSRNLHLSAIERPKAIIFYHTLINARKKLLSGERVESVKETVKEVFENMEDTTSLEYFEIVYSQTLQTVDHFDPHDEISLCIAGYVGKVRLIDNISLN